MTLLLGAVTVGLILSLLAIGVFISYRVFDFPDITVDGSITLGASIAAVLLVAGTNPVLATAAATVGGLAAGVVTGLLHTRFGINRLLSGILVMTGLYSVNLRVMGRSNVPLLSETTLATYAERAAGALLGDRTLVNVLGWEVGVRDLGTLGGSLVAVAAVALAVFLFLRTDLGTAMRATGDNSQMIRALGVDDRNMIVAGLAMANALVATAGALLAQYQGFADVQMGIGMIVWGLASVIIGQALVGTGHLGVTITGAVMGSVLFRLLVAIALRAGLNPNDLKLITAVFLLAALVLPGVLPRLRARLAPRAAAAPASGDSETARA